MNKFLDYVAAGVVSLVILSLLFALCMIIYTSPKFTMISFGGVFCIFLVIWSFERLSRD